MIKAVIDTNNIISGSINRLGYSAQIIRAMISGKFRFITSEAILEEVERVFNYPKIREKRKITNIKAQNILRVIRKYSEITKGKYNLSVIEEDPYDDKFIACAIEAKADYIVSGDSHLLNLKHFQKIQIVTAKQFIKILNI